MGRAAVVLGLVVQNVAAMQGSERRQEWRFPWRRTGHASKLGEATRELATLLAVDVPLLEALDTLILQHRGRFRTALTLVRDRIAAGQSGRGTARAAARSDSLSTCMVEVGENAGNLDVVLERLADFKERSLQLKDRVVSALLYPAIVFSVSMGVSLFLMTIVVPMLLENLEKWGTLALPWPTRILKGMSDVLITHGHWLALVGVAMIAGCVTLVRTERGSRIWHELLLRIPIIGPMSRKQEIARIVFVISTLMQSGIVFLEALRIAHQTTRNPLLRDALTECERRVRAGADIGVALERSTFFPQLVIHIFAVGQKSGRLEDMLERLAAGYDRQVASSAARLASALNRS